MSRNNEARSCNYCCSGKTITATFCVCVFAALGSQHVTRMRHIVICPTIQIFPHYLIDGKIFQKHFLNIKYFLIFSTAFSETFLIPRRIERDMINIYIGLHVKYPLFLSYFSETCNFLDEFLKNNELSNFMEIRQFKSRCPMQTDRQMDRHDEASSRFS